jgi:hypothetical protein
MKKTLKQHLWMVNNRLIPQLWNGNTQETITKIKEGNHHIFLAGYAVLRVSTKNKKPYFKILRNDKMNTEQGNRNTDSIEYKDLHEAYMALSKIHEVNYNKLQSIPANDEDLDYVKSNYKIIDTFTANSIKRYLYLKDY